MSEECDWPGCTETEGMYGDLHPIDVTVLETGDGKQRIKVCETHYDRIGSAAGY